MNPDPFRLDGRVAFVTGAGGGLGEGICTALAAAGAAVACADIDPERAERIAGRLRDDGGRALAFALDVTDSAAVTEAVRTTSAELGGVDVLVNNAAIYPRRAWTEITEAEWDRVFGVNLKSAIAQLQDLIPDVCPRSQFRQAEISGHIAAVGS